MPPLSISFGSSATAHVEENTDGIVRDVNAFLSGGNADEGLTYSITGGDDQALFTIDSATGALAFISSPDYENPLDVGADNIYNVTVTASDGGSTTGSQDLTITVTNDVVEATATPVTQGTIELAGLDAGRGFTIGGGPAGNYAGSSVASAGDINGDGFADVVIGAPNSWYYSSGSGMAYVVFGHAGDSGTTVDVTSLDGSNGFAMSGLAVGNGTGGSVASAGDVNGDGYDDLLISAYAASPNGNMSGQTYLIFGSGSGFPASVDLSSLDGSNGVTFNGSGAYDMAGVSVASAGDVNGDGIDDILIGARGSIPFFGSGTSAGKTYVVFGNGSGFGASVDLASLDGSNGFVVNGIQLFDMAGTGVSSAGDVNGDGYDDIVIGAPGVGSYTGAAYVLFGSGSGFSASVDLSSLDGTNGFVLSGLATGDRTGWSVSSAGDINGDGYDDILVGASTADANGSDSGATYVVFGSGGGFAASVDLSSLDGSNGFVIKGGSSGDRAGAGVSAAGDLNGDGYDDILIGASGVSSGSTYGVGGTYVLLGHGGSFGASLNLSTVASGDGSAGFMLTGIDANDQSGRAVSAAGDVNGDGFPDFIIGAPQAGGSSGEAYVIFGEQVTPAVQFASSADQTMMENTTGVVTDINASLNGGNADEGLTYSITGGADQADFSIDSATGVLSINATPDFEARNDVGNDNVYQVIVSATDGGALNNQQALNITITNDPSDDQPGVDQLFAIDGANGTVFNGIGADDLSGWSVSSAGDVNGDGYDDILIGAINSDANGSNSGQSYVVFGQSGGFGTAFDLSSLDGTNGFALTGANSYDKAGHSVSSAGDINGDGYDDILVGAYGTDTNGYSTGSTYVIFGSASGFAANVDLASLDGTNGFVLNGTAAYEDSGWSVSSAGDVNGDGYDDILIGAYRATPNGANSGATYVVFGSGSGFSASMDLSSLDGSNGFVLNGASAGEKSGWSVSSAGDVNGDGYADILIGAYKATANGSQSGATYVVFGSSSGFSASTDLSSLDGSNGFVINGVAAYDWSGFSVSSAGDVNGDGYDDILIGAHGADPNGAYSGAAYVVFGSAGGFSASFDLSSLDGTNGFVVNGANANDRAGFAVSSAGDVNGDGYDDILVGSYLSDPYFNNAGATYVIYGAASGFGASIELSSLAGGDRSVGYVLNGAHLNDNSGQAVAAAGDVNGDGADDLLIGAPFGDPHSRDNGQTYLVYGTLPATPAVIGGNTSGSVGEDETGTITGHLTISDVNGAAEESFNSDSLDGTYGSLTLDANGDWSYDLTESNSDVQALGAGDTLGDTFTIHSVDGTAQDIVITIDGANDAATFGGSLSASLTEDSDSVGGTATATDIDGADSFTPETLAGSYGSLSIGANGDWIYDLNGSNSNVQALGAGDTLSDTVTVHAADGTAQDIVITIDGANDAATFGGSLSASLTEDSDSVGGTATATDIDGADSFTPETLAGSYGSLSIGANGDWIYDLNRSSSNVQALGAGDTLSDTVTVHAADGTAQDIVLTVTGVNDAPTGPSLSSAGVQENQAGVFVGTLSAHDPEGDAVSFETADERFDIIGDELWLKAGVSLDYEATPSISLQVYASDPQGLNGGATVHFSVIDVAEGASAIGTSGNDTLDGGDGNDRIAGGGGNDFVVGDGVYGGSGNTGSEGSDTLIGGNGDDTLLGGGWNDSLGGSNGHYDDGEDVAGGTSPNRIWGGAGNDVAVGSDGDDRIGGGADDDYLKGLGGDDTLFGGSGDDTLKGGDGDDLIYNGQGNDSVEGDAGADTLWAGAGDDTLTGGDGADMFVFGAVSGDDTITDFDTTEDSLDLAARGFADMASLTTASAETTVDGQAGLLIDLGDGDSVFLVGLQVQDLGSMDITL